jgi:hypothetical protein
MLFGQIKIHLWGSFPFYSICPQPIARIRALCTGGTAEAPEKIRPPRSRGLGGYFLFFSRSGIYYFIPAISKHNLRSDRPASKQGELILFGSKQLFMSLRVTLKP